MQATANTATAVLAAKLALVHCEEASLLSRKESLCKVGATLTTAELRRVEALDVWGTVIEMTMDGELELAAAIAAREDHASPVRARAWPLAVKWVQGAASLKVCSKCNGSGRHRSMVASGVCFACNGKGIF